METRRGAPLKNQQFTVRESSIVQRKNEPRALPRNFYLLQCVIQALLRRIERLDKTKAKNTAKKVRALLWLLARHETRLLAPSPELFLFEPISEEFLKSMSSSQRRGFVPEHVEQDIEIGQFLLGNATIQRQLRRLRGGGGHEHVPEVISIQRKIVIECFNKHRLPTYKNTSDEAFALMQAWVDEHLPILMLQLKGIPCLCDYRDSKPVELPAPHSIGHAEDKKKGTPTKVFYRYAEREILLLILSYLHQSQPRQIDKLLKRL